jgi:nitrogen fixation/metabolism regulation signal transduction histidine kinase
MVLFAACFLKTVSSVLLRREKLDAFEKKQANLQKSLEEIEAQLQTQATSLESTADVMNQALAFMKDAASKQSKILTELAVQTSPSLIKLAPPPPPLSSKPTSAPINQLKAQIVAPEQRARAAATVQPTQLFSALVAGKTSVGEKRLRQYLNQAAEEDEEEDEDEVSSRLARRVQRHRKMLAQSKTFASER